MDHTIKFGDAVEQQEKEEVMDMEALKKKALEDGLKHAVVTRLMDIQRALHYTTSEFGFKFELETIRECVDKCSKLFNEIGVICDKLSKIG